jgi:hypothetical protein
MRVPPPAWLTLLIGLCLLFTQITLLAADIDSLLAADEAPDGVVFEILESDTDDLAWAIEKTRQQSQALRRRFPDIAIAVVSHGTEMFARRRSTSTVNWVTC